MPPGTQSEIVSKSGDLPASAYKLEEAALVLGRRIEGKTYLEISGETGLTLDQVRSICRNARQAGMLRDTIDILDNECVPQAVENIVVALRDREHPNHWRATEQVLNGRGAFQKHQSGKVVSSGHELPPLQINIIAPGGGDVPTVIVNSEQGSVVGNGHIDDAT